MLLIKHKALWAVDGYAPFARSRCQRIETSGRFKDRDFREVDAHFVEEDAGNIFGAASETKITCGSTNTA